MSGDERKTVLFFGNRFGKLSRTFFRGLVRAAARTTSNPRIALVDTSTAAESRLVRQVRNKIVSRAKSLLGVSVETSAIDWFQDRDARLCTQLTPPQHSLSANGFAQTLSELRPTLGLVAGCDQILREPVLAAIPRLINYHNSLLPKYRGVGAVQWAFLEREREAGYSFHTIESEAIDCGRLVLQKAFAIDERATPDTFSESLSEDAADSLGTVLEIGLGESWPPAGEPLGRGPYFSGKALRAIRRFDPSQPTMELLRRFGILNGLQIHSRWGKRLIVTALERAGGHDDRREMGSWRLTRDGLVVTCADGAVVIRSLDYLPAALLAALIPRTLAFSGRD